MINIYEGRKHLGPLDVAQINAAKNQDNLIKAIMLNDIVEQIQEAEAELKKEDLSKSDRLMLKMLKAQLNKHLCDFLGVPYDNRTSEDSQIPD